MEADDPLILREDLRSALPKEEWILYSHRQGREPNHWQQGPDQHFLHTYGVLNYCHMGGCWRSCVVPPGDAEKKDKSLCLYPVKLPSGQRMPLYLDMITTEEVKTLIRKYVAHLPSGLR